MKPAALTSVLILFLLPLLSHAQAEGFVPLIGIPGLTASQYTVNTYIDALYVLTISVAAFIVVVQLILAGFQYMFTDLVTSKEQAKRDIRNSFIGLFIILGAVLILNTINPQLTNLEALNLTPVTVNVNFPYGEGVPDPVIETPVVDNDTGLNIIENFDQLSAAEQAALIAACESPTSGTGGTWIRRGDGSAYCLGNESDTADENILNRPESLDEFIAANNLSETDAADLRRRYNQFVATQEPTSLTNADIEGIRQYYGANEVLFVVRPVQPASPEALAGYYDNQVALCIELTGSDNIVENRANGYVACVR